MAFELRVLSACSFSEKVAYVDRTHDSSAHSVNRPGWRYVSENNQCSSFCRRVFLVVDVSLYPRLAIGPKPKKSRKS